MKLLRIALSVAFFTALNTGTMQTQQEPSAAQFSKQDLICIHNAFAATASLIQQLDQIIGELAMLVKKHQIKGITSPDHIMRIFSDDRELLSFLLHRTMRAEDISRFSVL